MSSFAQQYRRCGKKNCGKCPHGPYWYETWWEDGRVKSKYHGKADPRTTQQQKEQDDPETGDYEGRQHARERVWDAIFDKRTASLNLAEEIMGLKQPYTYLEALTRFRLTAFTSHPDRGGDEYVFRCINAAWSWIKHIRQW